MKFIRNMSILGILRWVVFDCRVLVFKII
jgi:hypothetical protein